MYEAQITPKKSTKDSLRVHRTKGTIKMTATLLRYRDRDTRQIVFYIPSLDISGYGIDESKAKEMLDFSVNEFFLYLITLKPTQLQHELTSRGWEVAPFANKQFSHSYVSPDGELCNFNAVADEVEQLTVEI